MSLLLEALKKAELAKQQGGASQPGEHGPATVDPALGGLALEPQAGQRERTLITRDRLPDITQPLEILSEDLPSAGVRREAPPPASSPVGAEIPSTPAPSEPPIRASAASEGEERDRLSARQLFEAKETDYNPRRTFYLVAGALGVAAVGVVGYFLYQIYAPRPSFYTGPPPAAAPSVAGKPAPTVAPAPAQPVSAGTPAAAAIAAQPVAPSATAAPAPAAGPAPTTVASAPPPSQPVASAGTTRPAPARPTGGPSRAAGPSAKAAATEGEPPAASSSGMGQIKVTAAPQVAPGLDSAWQALQAGNLTLAREQYARVLASDPRNRDALLGLATVDARSQDFEAAEARYLKVLELDPRDAYAQAGLIALRGLTDPVQSESRIKNLLAQQPDAPLLHYALGNLYAVQSRWPEAQGAYFRAFAGDPESADYACNLAISLDHLRQPKLALEYYQRAVALAGNRAVGFNRAQVEARIRELTR